MNWLIFVAAFMGSFSGGALLFAINSITKCRETFRDELLGRRGIGFQVALIAYMSSIPISIVMIILALFYL